MAPVFKYFTQESHARALVDRGNLLMRSLSHFQAQEDGEVRGDQREGRLIYAPLGGLEITKATGERIVLQGTRFASAAMSDEIFVFCTSTVRSAELASRFQSRFCVKLSDPEGLARRIRARAHTTSRLDYSQLVHCEVVYQDDNTAPGVDWAFPAKLAFRKSKGFCWQAEHRFAVCGRGAFDAENVVCTLSSEELPQHASRLPAAFVTMRVGSLAAMTELHVF